MINAEYVVYNMCVCVCVLICMWFEYNNIIIMHNLYIYNIYNNICIGVCVYIYIYTIVYKVPVFISIFFIDLSYNHNPHYYIFWFHCLAVLLPIHFFSRILYIYLFIISPLQFILLSLCYDLT